ncbi:HEAT repeat domain-containing protein [Algoriphagus halophytocola]|uniref:HEAT repeat domain-containing protein n=1 Tax=Algoriphagus halophytocola TaxID=2991499 RepID=A0ABY6MJ66_9BACT|nr:MULTISPECIES: HEAT repeat domain-containing protein [unclassified Algoriphagus]UZD23203.1 HEAT repeat domain-containing protein [Algoriphagus sp. TR-M5]WBL44496.1 HEAT repeat domain-containing protein [Algoriphagus sp. TR-M9]
MEEEIQSLLNKMCNPEEKEAYFFADKLGSKLDDSNKDLVIRLVGDDNWEHAYLACRALSKSPYNEESLDAIFAAIHDKKNKAHQGAFVQILEEFDLSERFVDIFKVYLFGNYKSSTLAEVYLDSVEFELTPRTLRKAEKHWKHYLHNPEDEGTVQVKKDYATALLEEIRELFSEE